MADNVDFHEWAYGRLAIQQACPEIQEFYEFFKFMQFIIGTTIEQRRFS